MSLVFACDGKGDRDHANHARTRQNDRPIVALTDHFFSTNRLAARLQSGKEETIGFDKDDDDTLDFVAAASNLRSFAYGIERKTRWEVKGECIISRGANVLLFFPLNA